MNSSVAPKVAVFLTVVTIALTLWLRFSPDPLVQRWGWSANYFLGMAIVSFAFAVYYAFFAERRKAAPASPASPNREQKIEAMMAKIKSLRREQIRLLPSARNIRVKIEPSADDDPEIFAEAMERIENEGSGKPKPPW